MHLDKRDQVALVLTSLSKDFETKNHSLLLAELKAYNDPKTSLKVKQNYLCNTFQRTKVNGSFSKTWQKCLQEFVKVLFWSHCYLTYF